MSYGTPKVNRYWKRPKPRVYDCNVRDAERFYQDSYKQYLAEKEDAARRAGRSKSIDFDPEYYNHLRADRIPPSTRKETTRSNVDRTDLPPLPPQLADAVKSRLADVTTTETSFTARTEGLPSFDASTENLSLDQRLERLRKLREELGLPGDTKPGASTSERLAAIRSESASRSTTVGESDTPSYKFDLGSRGRAGSASRAEDASSSSSLYNYKSERSSRMNGTGGGAGGGLSDDYKFKSERTSSFKSERNADDYKLPSKSLDFELPSKTERKQLNLSPALERKKDYSLSSAAEKTESSRYSSLSSGGGAASSSTSRSSARKAATTTDVEVEDIDVSDMMKKMPTSQQILEKISKMDLDD